MTTVDRQKVYLQVEQDRASAILVHHADSEGWRSAFRTDGDHHSEVMAISVPN
jgi:hypothetical protein